MFLYAWGGWPLVTCHFGEHRHCKCGLRQRFKVERIAWRKCSPGNTHSFAHRDSVCCMPRSTHALLPFTLHELSQLATVRQKDVRVRPSITCHIKPKAHLYAQGITPEEAVCYAATSGYLSCRSEQAERKSWGAFRHISHTLPQDFLFAHSHLPITALRAYLISCAKHHALLWCHIHPHKWGER